MTLSLVRKVCPIFFALVVVSAAPRAASRAQAQEEPCNNGPRRVPKSRGAALRRASALGLGSRRVAAQLITTSPKPEWVRAAKGRKTKKLLWPVAGAKLGRGFGFTRTERKELQHDGLDLAARRGETVRAAADGIVAYSDNGLCGYGNTVLIVHNNGWVTLYAHHDRNLVQAGTRVNRGARIGLVGATGKAQGPHLHFELRDHGKPRDPIALMIKAAPKESKRTHVTRAKRCHGAACRSPRAKDHGRAARR